MTTITTLDYTDIINNLCPNSIFTITDNNYSTLVWSENNSDSKPTEQEILEKNKEMINIIAYDHLRFERDELLSKTDKYVLPDYPHANDSIRNQWLIYRQGLRDITSKIPAINLETGEIDIVWPTQPS